MAVYGELSPRVAAEGRFSIEQDRPLATQSTLPNQSIVCVCPTDHHSNREYPTDNLSVAIETQVMYCPRS